MTFATAATNGSGGGGSGSCSRNGAKGKGAAGQNVENKELAARQQKGLAQATARKRRILGVGWFCEARNNGMTERQSLIVKTVTLYLSICSFRGGCPYEDQ